MDPFLFQLTYGSTLMKLTKEKTKDLSKDFNEKFEKDIQLLLDEYLKTNEMSTFEIKDFYLIATDIQRLLANKIKSYSKNYGHIIYDTWDTQGKTTIFKLIMDMLSTFNTVYISSLQK